MKRWFRAINWVIAFLLFVVGLVVIRCPNLIGSKEAAATLAGALFGAAALFVGAEISKLDQRARAKEDFEEKRRRIRVALTAELVGICVKHIESAKFFRESAKLLSEGTGSSRNIDFDRYLPPEPFVYQALLTQITSLTEAEIDALATFYGNLDRTRKLLLECKNSGVVLRLLNAEMLAGSFEHDCSTADNVVTLLAPTRKIQKEGEQPILLAELLRNTARRSHQLSEGEI